MFKKFFIVKCNYTLANLIENRASEIGINVSEYLKYLVVKDIEEATINQTIHKKEGSL